MPPVNAEAAKQSAALQQRDARYLMRSQPHEA